MKKLIIILIVILIFGCKGIQVQHTKKTESIKSVEFSIKFNTEKK